MKAKVEEKINYQIQINFSDGNFPKMTCSILTFKTEKITKTHDSIYRFTTVLCQQKILLKMAY